MTILFKVRNTHLDQNEHAETLLCLLKREKPGNDLYQVLHLYTVKSHDYLQKMCLPILLICGRLQIQAEVAVSGLK